MIPKRIHYCWFGKGEFPEKVKQCMKSWEELLEDYEFFFWNEETFDVSEHEYTNCAYRTGNYAFVSDYVRFWALCKYGGIYVDTDVEVVKSFDSILENQVVMGTDEGGYIEGAFIASEANHPYLLEMLEVYDSLSFLRQDGAPNKVVVNHWMEMKLKDYGYVKADTFQGLKCGIMLFPSDFFHGKDQMTGELNRTQNTYCIHHHTLLWITKKTGLIRWIRMNVLIPLLGKNAYEKVAGVIKRILRHRSHVG